MLCSRRNDELENHPAVKGIPQGDYPQRRELNNPIVSVYAY